ncbi:hypothetical protein Pint_31923 [Pistacia integerrima]|uniref:Uncharacterized protein n=1 Tax=Pistacia integerrima TaxID=434235 RepID=A0ACC0XMH4_9ROSI|nr:hypothetical protein Pint_31923 [Pistacia integerrima]
MGEMILGHYRDDLPLVITRHTIVTSTHSQPFPGWIEGLRTVDRRILDFGKGKLKFLPGKPDTIHDLIPADMVVSQIIVAMMANANQSSQIIYQFVSSMRKPLNFSNPQEFSIWYFAKRPLINKNGKPATTGKFKILKTPTRFRLSMAIRYVLPLKVCSFDNFYAKNIYEDICIDSARKIKFAIQIGGILQTLLVL